MANADVYSTTRNPVEDALYQPVRSPRRPLTVPSYQPRASVGVTPAAPAPAPMGAAPSASVPPSGEVPSYTNPNDNLAMWGYTGEIPINNLEQQAIDFVNQMYGAGGELETTGPAQDYYNAVLRGEFGPESQAYVEALIDPMRARMTSDYNDASKALATRFSDIGGFYGGRSGVAQGRLAALTNQNMADEEARLRYQAFADNMNRMSGAAGGLESLAKTRSGLSGDMLNYLLSAGNVITGRDVLNRSEYHNALGRSYQDWLRARQELLMPFSMAGGLIGTQATQPIVTQSQSPWGALLGGVGQAIGIGGGKALGSWLT